MIHKIIGLDLTGKLFGRLSVTSFSGSIPTPCGSKQKTWLCKCVCGRTTTARHQNLLEGHTKSCGCGQGFLSFRPPNPYRCNRPRMTDHPIYATWLAMKQRCDDPKYQAYRNYGGRGIKIDDIWRRSFSDFYFDMIGGWALGMSIDRIDVNGNYCKTNCRWATKREQASNRRNNIILEYNGKKQTVAAWSRELGLSSSVIYRRVSEGKNSDRALCLRHLNSRH